MRLLLVDDDRDLAELMVEFFSGHEIGLETRPDGVSGLERALNGGFDLILLDVMMPGLDGFQVLAKLRQKSDVPVLMLTAKIDPQSRIDGLEGGADDYLPKPFDPMELLARVRAILRRVRKPAPPAPADGLIELHGIRLDPGSRTVKRDDTSIPITSVEYEVLDVLMRAAGRVVTRDELAQRLYQRDATPFDRAIDVHVSHLRRKLGGPRELIRTVRGTGYQFSSGQVE